MRVRAVHIAIQRLFAELMIISVIVPVMFTLAQDQS